MRPEQQLREFVTTLEYDDVPDSAVDTVTRAIVDTVGVTLAGAVEGAGQAVATSTGVDTATDAAALLSVTSAEEPPAAALRVGTASHALDYDDLSWGLDGHPSVTLVPPLLALADAVDASGRDLVAAYAAGFEVECAVAEPISPAHYEAGWHATSTFGTFGAAAAAAHLLDLDETETGRALNVAASMPSGTKRNFGSMTKPLHAGLCARSGVTAATLAADGLTAGKTSISGTQGFWDLYDPTDGSFDDFEQVEFSIGDEWALETAGIHVKAYPCCYFTHTAIAATQGLLDSGVEPDAIERIEVRAAGGAGDALTNPEPETGLEAKFSMEHAVACAVARDRVGLAEFEDDATDDPELAELRELVEFEVDESLPYDSHEATVRIVTDSEAFERRQENPPGVHENPLSESEFRSKFEACAARAVSVEGATALYETLSSLPEVDDVTAVLRTA